MWILHYPAPLPHPFSTLLGWLFQSYRRAAGPGDRSRGARGAAALEEEASQDPTAAATSSQRQSSTTSRPWVTSRIPM